jgi:hypothetical protein
MSARFLFKQMPSEAAGSQNSSDIVTYCEKCEVLNLRRAALNRGESGGLYLLGAGVEQTRLQIGARRIRRIHDAD